MNETYAAYALQIGFFLSIRAKNLVGNMLGTGWLSNPSHTTLDNPWLKCQYSIEQVTKFFGQWFKGLPKINYQPVFWLSMLIFSKWFKPFPCVFSQNWIGWSTNMKHQPGDSSRDLLIPDCWRSRLQPLKGSRVYNHPKKGTFAEFPGRFVLEQRGFQQSQENVEPESYPFWK